jgi:hypothetical protein
MEITKHSQTQLKIPVPSVLGNLPLDNTSASVVLPTNTATNKLLAKDSWEKQSSSTNLTKKPLNRTSEPEQPKKVPWGSIALASLFAFGVGVIGWMNRENIAQWWHKMGQNTSEISGAVPKTIPTTLINNTTQEVVQRYSNQALDALELLPNDSIKLLQQLPEEDDAIRGVYTEALLKQYETIQQRIRTGTAPNDELYQHRDEYLNIQEISQSLKACVAFHNNTNEAEKLKALEAMLSYIGKNEDGSCALISKAQVELLTGQLLERKHNQYFINILNDSKVPIYSSERQEFLLPRVKVNTNENEISYYSNGDKEYYQHAREATDKFWGLRTGQENCSAVYTNYAEFEQYLNALPKNYVCYLTSKGHMQVLLKLNGKSYIIQNYADGSGVGITELKRFLHREASFAGEDFNTHSPFTEKIGFFQCFHPENSLSPVFQVTS